GQITDGGHVLVFPKKHILCASAVPQSELQEFLDIVYQTESALEHEFGVLVGGPPTILFEHGIVGQTVKHAHIHLVPADVELTSRMMFDFPNAEFAQCNFFETGIPHEVDMRPRPYLLSVPPINTRKNAPVMTKADILWEPHNVPAHYFRTRLAEALGRPERANWRTMDPELDKRLWSETVERLKKYF
ncbi:MAG: HIT domain-containing protein, partial [Candidatus Uhrbacteria bacterium]|nr:HIT domain-containing protein [Candidatus Uhrbacteria bacterium]